MSNMINELAELMKKYNKQFSCDPDGRFSINNKPEPKAPTHREIMTKWWKDCDSIWYKPIAYGHGKYYMHGDVEDKAVWECRKDWFTGRESADIPPEA